MKKKLTIIILLSIILITIINTLVFYPDIEESEKRILGAHRGNSIDFTENSIPAFQSAVEEDKYKFIEFDVQYTKDKVPVVHHDLSLLRLQKKSHKIKDLTYDELRKVSKYKIPKYREVMGIVAGKKPLNIEIKSQGNFEDDKALTDYIIQDLKRKGILKSTLISSISPEVIAYINDKYNHRKRDYWHIPYINFWFDEREVDTGIIFYVKSETFTEGFPILDDIRMEFRNSNTLKTMDKTMWDSGANYIMVHQSNIRNSKRLALPFDSKIVYWTFDDKMYLILPEGPHFSYSEEREKFKLKESVPWWEKEVHIPVVIPSLSKTQA